MVALDVTRLSIREVGAALRRQELSPLELTEAVLARIAARNPELNAYITVTADAARESARAADAELRAGIALPTPHRQ